MLFLGACSTKATDPLVTIEKDEPIINETAPETLEESEVVSEIEESTVEVETPAVKPETPVVKPETPAVKPETPAVKPETPAVKPETPAVKPETPAVKPETPAVKPETPVVEPETPAVKPETPAVKPETPVVEPEEPVVEDNKNFNQALENLSITVGERDLGVVVHNLDESKLTTLNLVEYIESPIEETFLFVPTYVGSSIKIYEMSFGDAGLVAGDVLFELSNSKQNEALYLKCVVPEGIPHIKVVMSYEDQVSEYIIRYDGVGNRAQVEYLK